MNPKLFTELYIRKATDTYWSRVQFDDEQFEELSDFLFEMFPHENGLDIDFVCDNSFFKIRDINEKI